MKAFSLIKNFFLIMSLCVLPHVLFSQTVSSSAEKCLKEKATFVTEKLICALYSKKEKKSGSMLSSLLKNKFYKDYFIRNSYLILNPYLKDNLAFKIYLSKVCKEQVKLFQERYEFSDL